MCWDTTSFGGIFRVKIVLGQFFGKFSAKMFGDQFLWGKLGQFSWGDFCRENIFWEKSFRGKYFPARSAGFFFGENFSGEKIFFGKDFFDPGIFLCGEISFK